MTKLNEKPLSQMLEEIEPKETRKELFGHLDAIPMYSHYVDRASYDHMKAVAIELANGVEYIMRDMPSKAKEKFDKNEVTYFCKEAGAEVLDHRFEHAIVCRDVLSRAKDIIGGGE